MTVKKIRFSEEGKKEPKNLKFSREKLIEMSKKKTFKNNLLPNLESIKNEVNNFKKERSNWIEEKKKKVKKSPPKEIKTEKLTKTKHVKRENKFNSKKNKKFNNKQVNYKKHKRKNTKKLNEIEIIVLFEHLVGLLKRNKIHKITTILNKIKRKQFIQILNYFNIFKHDTSAPTPLLKNIVFNLLFKDMNIS